MNPQDIINNFKSANPSYNAAAPNGSNWLSDVQSGAYRLGGSNQMNNQGSTTPANGNGAQILGNLKNTFVSGARNVTEDVTNVPKNAQAAGGGKLATGLSALSGAGHIAGDIAGTAGGVLGSFISPLLSDTVKSKIGDASRYISDKVNALPGMTPELHKGLGDVFNTISLLGGEKAEPVATRAAEQGAKVIGSTVESGKNAIVSGVKAPIIGTKNAVQRLVTPIPENVKSMLKRSINPKETEGNLTKYFNQAYYAKKTTGIATPLDVSGKNQLGGALKEIKGKLVEAGQAKTTALAEHGSKVVSIKDAYSSLGQALKDRLGTAYDGQGNLASTEGRQSLVIGNKADENVVKLAHSAIEDLQRNPTLQKVNDVVDRLQNQLYKSKQLGAEPITNQTKAVINEFTHNLNEAATKVGGSDYKNANDTYSTLRPIHDDLSNRLGQNMKNAGSVMKRIFSPQDAGTKDLITKIEDITGRRIFDHATLSKFAMDSVGDARARSLLDKIPEGKGFTMKIINGIIEKLQNPESVAKNLIPKKLKAK